MKKIKLVPLKNIICALLSVSVFASANAKAEATFQIWPIYPKIENNAKATAVWLKNVGKDDAVVQIRVFRWTQKDGHDSYIEQSEIIPSPPIVKIKADEKTMLRLSRAQSTPDGQEYAYRIIVDELPIQVDDNNQVSDKPRVNFQMRYSIPLFTYGKGLGSGLSQVSAKDNAKNPLAKPILAWSIAKDEKGSPLLVVKNSGQKYALLGNVKTTAEGNILNAKDNKPVTGYILAGSENKIEITPSVEHQLSNVNVLYGIDSSGPKSQIIEMTRE